jgi:hypothetical protein
MGVENTGLLRYGNKYCRCKFANKLATTNTLAYFVSLTKKKSIITLTTDPFDLLWHFKRGIRQQVEKFPGKTCQNKFRMARFRY